MDIPYKESLKNRIQDYANPSVRKQNRAFYESSENLNMLTSSIFAHTISKTLTAPLLRIKTVQQAAYESITGKPKSLKFTEAYGRKLIRYSKKSRIFRFVKRKYVYIIKIILWHILRSLS